MNTPVLIIVFNRPDFFLKIINTLKKVKPKKIYIKLDGPRKNNLNDYKQIKKNLIVIKKINWKCKILINKEKKNLGSMNNPVKGINWLFKNETKGIILEDDCLPSKSFFRYCDELLAKYKYNKNISMISGRNNLETTDINQSYYYTFGNTWGWATWRRAWRFNDVKLKNWNNKKFKKNLQHNLSKFPSFLNSMIYKCEKIKKKSIKSVWDYQWFFSIISRNMIGIVPHINLVKNLGFDNRSTHTFDKDFKNFNIKYFQIKFPLKHNYNQTIHEKLLSKEFNRVYKTSNYDAVKKYLQKLYQKIFKA